MKNVLLLKTGTVAPALMLRSGDYDTWFARTFGPGVHLDIVPLNLGSRPRRPATDYDAVVMTGSSLSVIDLSDWMKRAADDLKDAADAKVPVLGVCFGHQLLGHVYGSKVVKNPNGRETGSVQVQLTAAGRKDELFAGLRESFVVQATHEDIVDRAPPGATVLAGNANTATQALAFAPHVRGVQFHPELSPDTVRALIETRVERLAAEGPRRGVNGPEFVRSLLAGIQPSPAGPRILSNFLEHFC